MRARLERIGIDPRHAWIAVHPGATAPSRRYPTDRLGEVLRRLDVRTGWPIVLTGIGERTLVEEVRRAGDGLGTTLAGQLTTAEVAALVAIAPLVLTNNSVPAHIAAAVGTPVVDLYALTNIQHTPWAVPNRVLSVDVPCKGCRRSVCPLGHNRCSTRSIRATSSMRSWTSRARRRDARRRRRLPPRPETTIAANGSLHLLRSCMDGDPASGCPAGLPIWDELRTARGTADGRRRSPRI